MAEETEQPVERKPTERVVLQERAVLVIDGINSEKVEEAIKVLGLRRARKGEPVVELAWQEVARLDAVSKTAAIELHAGKPGTPDAKIGTFRAPPLTGWKGAMVYEAPPAPLVERRAVD